MDYISTRGAAPRLKFDGALLSGLARDGGLYIPADWPTFTAAEIRAFQGLSYADLAVRVMMPFIGDVIKEDDFAAIVHAAYAEFGHPAVAPLKQLGPDQWVMELFHGPTLAFKDYALQLVGRLFDHVLKAQGAKVTIIGATSGDTGSAAIEACRDREAIQIFILHPHGRVSEVQRRQMTTVMAANVHNIALEGTFDDCQDYVKALFNDMAFRDRYTLSAVNSINWARIMAQIVYYFWAAVALGAPDRKVTFAVPTGNFGNVYAGYCARKMGLPIAGYQVASNRNDILTRYFETGTMQMVPVEPSLSPSMDIQVSSNFERLLADHYADGAALAAALTAFRETGSQSFGDDRWQAILESFRGYRLDDDSTKTVIREIYESTGELLDPHTATGVAAALSLPRDAGTPVVALATAHPAKFPDAVQAASGIRPVLPPRMADLFDREENCTVLGNDLDAVRAHITETLSLRNAS
ncbi:MAG: threonine synthase [Magnetospiraceae bacterium]